MPCLPAARKGDETGHGIFVGSSGACACATHGHEAGQSDKYSGGAALRGAWAGGNMGGACGCHARAPRGPHMHDPTNDIIWGRRGGGGGEHAGGGGGGCCVVTGSANVCIGGTDAFAARGTTDAGKCAIHHENTVADGSATVWINGVPASRASDKLGCSGGLIMKGCETVLIGGDAHGSSRITAEGCGCQAVRNAYAGEACGCGRLVIFVQITIEIDIEITKVKRRSTVVHHASSHHATSHHASSHTATHHKTPQHTTGHGAGHGTAHPTTTHHASHASSSSGSSSGRRSTSSAASTSSEYGAKITVKETVSVYAVQYGGGGCGCGCN